MKALERLKAHLNLIFPQILFTIFFRRETNANYFYDMNDLMVYD